MYICIVWTTCMILLQFSFQIRSSCFCEIVILPMKISHWYKEIEAFTAEAFIVRNIHIGSAPCMCSWNASEDDFDLILRIKKSFVLRISVIYFLMWFLIALAKDWQNLVIANGLWYCYSNDHNHRRGKKKVAKGIVMGLAGSKFSRRIIPKGWRCIKVTS